MDIETSNEKIDTLIDEMCITWRHDFDAVVDVPKYLDEGKRIRTAGITQVEREDLRSRMRQLLTHHAYTIHRLVADAIEAHEKN